jgi:hypothetical protein
MKNFPPFILVVLALGLFTSARIAEQVRAGIQALPGPALRRHGAGLHHAADLPLRAAAHGLPHHHPAADQRVDEHLQELVGGLCRVHPELTMFACRRGGDRARIEVYLAVTGCTPSRPGDQPHHGLHREARPRAGFRRRVPAQGAEMLNLDFSLLNWGLIQNFVLKGLYFSIFLTVVATAGGISSARCWR